MLETKSKTIVFLSKNDFGPCLNPIEVSNKADQIVPLVMGVGQLKKGQDFDGKFFAFAGKEVPDAYLALPDIMFGQTIALLTSIKVGNTPDTPSPTGTVNRVVKGVTIHKFIK